MISIDIFKHSIKSIPLSVIGTNLFILTASSIFSSNRLAFSRGFNKFFYSIRVIIDIVTRRKKN